MKRLLIATAAGLLLFSGQTGAEASEIENLNEPVAEVQELGKWAEIRDDILGRESDRDRQARREWERKRRYSPPPPPPPPPSRYGGRRDYSPPPPPPPPRYGGRHDYYPPPPPPPPMPPRGYGAPPPPPPRYR